MAFNALWWWIDRWRKSTAYTDMTLEQQGAYRNLLDEATLRGGALPDNQEVLAKACGDPRKWKRVRDVVMARFELKSDGWHHTTLDAVLEESRRRREKQSRYRLGRGNGGGNGTSNDSGYPDPDLNHRTKDTNLPPPNPRRDVQAEVGGESSTGLQTDRVPPAVRYCEGSPPARTDDRRCGVESQNAGDGSEIRVQDTGGSHADARHDASRASHEEDARAAAGANAAHSGAISAEAASGAGTSRPNEQPAWLGHRSESHGEAASRSRLRAIVAAASARSA